MPDGGCADCAEAWRVRAREVTYLRDVHGAGVETGIRGAVVALRAHLFETVASCEGHLDGSGLPYAWIDIAGWSTHRLPEILGWFYEGRPPERDPRGHLAMLSLGFGQVRLLPIGAGAPDGSILAEAAHTAGLEEFASLARWLRGRHTPGCPTLLDP